MTAAAMRFAGVRPRQRATLVRQADKTDRVAETLDATLDSLATLVDLLEDGRRDRPAPAISSPDIETVSLDT